MSKITFDNCSTISDVQQSIKKRVNSEESNSITKKKIKCSIDVTTYWKKIQSIYKTNTTKIFECKSKNDCKRNFISSFIINKRMGFFLDLIITDPLGDRSRFIISKSSYYWLNESIRLMQQHVEYGTTFNAAIMGEIIEIERNLKALKLNVEKNGIEKTFFYRAEALLNFIRLCCTFFGKEYFTKNLFYLSIY
jgi:hypothetical protein